MKQMHRFQNPDQFTSKFHELLESGITRDQMNLYYPHPVHGLDDAIDPKPSFLRWFTFTGAVSGLITGFAFTIYSVLSWSLNSSGKPLISIPAFIIIAFELTILFGAVLSFGGFLLLSRLPSVPRIMDPIDFENEFVIVVDAKDAS